MVTIIKPFTGDGRIVYEATPFTPNFMDVSPPIRQGYGKPYEKGNRDFFLEYRKQVLSKYLNRRCAKVLKNLDFPYSQPRMYKWGSDYPSYAPHAKVTLSHGKQRWEEMYSKPKLPLTFKDSSRIREIDDFYMLCQFQRQYYNDYTGNAHPMDYFKKYEDKWKCAQDLNSVYVQCPETYVKYKQPLTLPLTMRRAWTETLEPTRRLAGKRDPYPDLKFSR